MPRGSRPRRPAGRGAARDVSLSDADLDRPGSAWARYTKWLSSHPEARPRLARFQHDARLGPLGPVTFLSDLGAWVVEEFACHGAPGSGWHPVDAYLDFVGDRLSARGKSVFSGWKQAPIGFHEVLDVEAACFTGREWSPADHAHVGEAKRIVPAGADGMKPLGGQVGNLLLIYVAPWAVEAGLFVAGGYGRAVPKGTPTFSELLLSFRRPEVLTAALPWYAGRRQKEQLHAEWRQRHWPAWFAQHLAFPFRALVPFEDRVDEVTVTDVVQTEAETARQMGVYFRCAMKIRGEAMVLGATRTIPPEVGSPNWRALQEYWEYRSAFGLPPGTVGQKDVVLTRKGR